jgi:glutamine amidotransferase-like uncharacterized protein
MLTLPLALLLLAPRPAAEPPPLPPVAQANLEKNLRWMLDRERHPKGKAVRVGVWADAGVWHEGAKAVVAALEGEGVPCRVIDRSLLTSDGLKGLDAVVLPGGWAPHQWGAAGEGGLEAVKKFVEGGGRGVGVCAGAYLLSATVKYDGQSYPYPLGLFDGAAVGPVKGLAAYPEWGAAKLTTTDAGKKRGLEVLDGAEVAYSGGPCFEKGTDVTVLARYADGSAAAVSRPVGKGEVVLLGGHPELSPKPDGPLPRHAGPVYKALTLGK